MLCFVILLASSFNMSLYFSGENNIFTVYIKQTRNKRERNVIWSDEKHHGLPGFSYKMWSNFTTLQLIPHTFNNVRAFCPMNWLSNETKMIDMTGKKDE